MLSFKPAFSLFSFTFIKRLFSSSSLSAVRMVSSANLRLLIFLLACIFRALLWKLFLTAGTPLPQSHLSSLLPACWTRLLSLPLPRPWCHGHPFSFSSSPRQLRMEGKSMRNKRVYSWTVEPCKSEDRKLLGAFPRIQRKFMASCFILLFPLLRLYLTEFK